jgi:hypothetical protein
MKMSRRMTSNFLALLTLLSVCLIINALPSMQNVKIVDDENNLKQDKSDNSSGDNVTPVLRYHKMNKPKLMARTSEIPSKCGYEVFAVVNQSI